MATYQGSPFEAGVGPDEGDIVLFAACPPPEELGFEPATGHWRKQVRIGDVQAVWESRPVGTFRGARCMVLDDLGDRLHIGYLGHDEFEAERLGYWQVDRGVFELVAPKTQVSEIIEERASYSARPAPPAPGSTAPGSTAQGSTAPGSTAPGSIAPANTPGSTASGSVPPSRAASLLTDLPPADPLAGAKTAAGGTGWPEPSTPAEPPGPVGYDWTSGHDTGQFTYVPPFDQAGATAFAESLAPQGYLPVPDEVSGVALPTPAQSPLPLEAEAMRAASASRRARTAPPRPTAQSPSQSSARRPGFTPAAVPAWTAGPAGPASVPDPAPSQRPAAPRRLATEQLFGELAGLAGIPAGSYAMGEEVDGALCLLQTPMGFEVFHSAGGARHEAQTFATEEAACFYLFGLLAAEAVRSGSLLPAAGHARLASPASRASGRDGRSARAAPRDLAQAGDRAIVRRACRPGRDPGRFLRDGRGGRRRAVPGADARGVRGLPRRWRREARSAGFRHRRGRLLLPVRPAGRRSGAQRFAAACRQPLGVTAIYQRTSLSSHRSRAVAARVQSAGGAEGPPLPKQPRRLTAGAAGADTSTLRGSVWPSPFCR